MKRRSFLASILAASVAPAAVGSGILMPVRRIITPDYDALLKRVAFLAASDLDRALENLIVFGVHAVDGQGRDVSRELWFDPRENRTVKPALIPAGHRVFSIVTDSAVGPAAGITIGLRR